MKLYIYKKYCDELYYGEESITIFPTKKEATDTLKKDVEESYGCSWEDIPEEFDLNEGDTFKPDYVAIDNGDGAVSFWIVEEKTVKVKSKSRKKFFTTKRHLKNVLIAFEQRGLKPEVLNAIYEFAAELLKLPVTYVRNLKNKK